jgi:hypothetical protein
MGRIVVRGTRDDPKVHAGHYGVDGTRRTRLLRGAKAPLGLLSLVATIVAPGCGGGTGGKGIPDGSAADGGTVAGSDGPPRPDPALFANPSCRTPYPAHTCDGDPHGRWTLAGLCVKRYESCPGAMVTTTGTATATIEFQAGSPEAYFEYQFDYDLETRLSVPLSCLAGASCESIGCFAGMNPCACVLGSGRGGSVRAQWTPNITGEVVTPYSEGSQKSQLRFCAGATTADSMIGATRVIWNRVCTENMDCRSSNPCHVGKAHCTGAALACEDTGANRPVGSPCGTDKVCDASGACVPCAAGAACQLDNQPCKTAIISCRTAAPVCMATGNVKDGTACGVKRACLGGVCKSDDGEPCKADSECRESCTCGDAQCSTRYCGRSCLCRYAPPGGQCAGFLADGTSQAPGCNKACFQGRCLTEVGQRCTRDSECGSGHCTCWLQSCAGGRLCSKVACPCQWASSGADTCGGPLMEGLGDLTCLPPQMCLQGMCK